MNTPHDPRPKPRKRPRRRGGAPKGNQNARKHGRYSELRPADRAAFMRKTLRSHGLKGPFAPGALSIEELLDDPNTNVRLLYLLLKTTIGLVHVEDRLSRQ